MRVIKNEARIQRNVKLGQWTSLIGILLMAGSMYLLFITQQRPELANYGLIPAALGLVLTFISSNLGNRYGGAPRLDETLDAGLKGLPGDFTLYHFTTPASHLMVGPAGIWVLMPYRQVGRVEYRNNRWRLSGGGFMHAYMRFFGQDRIGRPEADTAAEINTVHKLLASHMDENEIPPIEAMLIFTHPQIEIEPGNSPIPVLRIKQIKEFFRQKAKQQVLSSLQIARLKSILE
jgi:hypothetical protein